MLSGWRASSPEFGLLARLLQRAVHYVFFDMIYVVNVTQMISCVPGVGPKGLRIQGHELSFHKDKP